MTFRASWPFQAYLLGRLWVGVVFSKVVVTFNHLDGSFNLFKYNTEDVWIIPSCRIWVYVLHVEHISWWQDQLWPTSVSHPFPYHSSLGLAGGKHYQKVTIPIFRHVLQNVAHPGCMGSMCQRLIAIFSPYLLLVGLLLQYVALFQPRELVMG